jgi:hypothetical protein
MALVTIEGSVTPSSHLGRGERRTVERTDFIDKLIRNGYVTVVETITPPFTEEDLAEAIAAIGDEPVKVVPAADDSLELWQEFMADQVDPLILENATRDELVAIWTGTNG